VNVRRPTDEEYAAYDGNHCNWLWPQTPDGWRCPCCSRTKREIMRWGIRKSKSQFIGPPAPPTWKCGLHKHHDLFTDFGLSPRFPPTLICGACNWLDACAKRAVGAPEWFSFSPDEIRSFIAVAKINGPIILNVEAARQRFIEVTPLLQRIQRDIESDREIARECLQFHWPREEQAFLEHVANGRGTGHFRPRQPLLRNLHARLSAKRLAAHLFG
jgi:hypothetical protein